MRRRFPNIEVSDLIAELRRLCEGLFYTSETDAAVVPFHADTTEKLGPSGDQSRDSAKIEKVEPELFFDRLTAERDWHDAKKRDIAKRFARLQRCLEENLTDIEVWRIGRIRIEIIVSGRHPPTGEIVGVRTEAVET